jgi:hypothetical protein
MTLPHEAIATFAVVLLNCDMCLHPEGPPAFFVAALKQMAAAHAKVIRKWEYPSLPTRERAYSRYGRCR